MRTAGLEPALPHEKQIFRLPNGALGNMLIQQRSFSQLGFSGRAREAMIEDGVATPSFV